MTRVPAQKWVADTPTNVCARVGVFYQLLVYVIQQTYRKTVSTLCKPYCSNSPRQETTRFPKAYFFIVSSLNPVTSVTHHVRNPWLLAL